MTTDLDDLAALRRCRHAYCAGERWCKLNTAVGLPEEIPACTCAYGTDRIARDWHDPSCEFEQALAVLLSEPPDGTRIEFEHWTDVYAAWRDDECSRSVGWRSGDGGETWCLYGHTVPVSWTRMLSEWGPDVLRLAVRLVPDPDDAGKRAQWPTEVRRAVIAAKRIRRQERKAAKQTAAGEKP